MTPSQGVTLLLDKGFPWLGKKRQRNLKSSDCVQPGRLDNDIVDDAASDEEVGCEDECKDGPGGGGLNAFSTYFTFLWKA